MQRNRLPSVIAAGAAIVLVALAFAAMGSPSSRAGEPPAVAEMPAFPPTPTVPPAPELSPDRQRAGALFADSFSSADSLKGWTIADVGQVLPGEESVWRVVDGRLIQDRTARAYNPDFRDTMALTGSPSWADYTVEASVYDAASATFGLVARERGNAFYRFRWFHNETDGDRKMMIEKVVNGEATELAGANAPGYEHRRWYRIALRVSGDQITALVDGQVVLQARDSSISSGRAGVTTIAFGAVTFDDVTVSAP